MNVNLEMKMKEKKNLTVAVTDLILEMTNLSSAHENKITMINDKEEEKKEDQNLALPHDLIVEILLRLPVKSLVCFRTVCKSWFSLISNPQFAKSHFDLAASPTHRVLLNAGSEFASLDLQASIYDDSAVVNLKSPPYTAPSFLTLGSCRGFILLAKETGPSAGDLIVWNPSTCFHKQIPVAYGYDNWEWGSWYDPSTRLPHGVPCYVIGMRGYFMYGFGYDHSKDDYLFVFIRLRGLQHEVYENCRFIFQNSGPEVTFAWPQIEVLSLKTNVPSFTYGEGIEYEDFGHGFKSGLFFNQSLHWMATSKVSGLEVVIAFDLVERNLSEIPLSPDLIQEIIVFQRMFMNCHLRVFGGCLGLCHLIKVDGLEMTVIWVMKEYKVQSSWTKSFVVRSDFLPIFSTDGGVFGSNLSGIRFEKFNYKGELLENHTYVQENKGALRYFDMCRESLLTLPSELSLPGDFEEANEDNWQSLERRNISY